jgi:uncharacterized protein YjiS (DUF1127 family)
MTRLSLAIISPTYRVRQSLARLLAWLQLWWQRGRERRRLPELSEHQLRDIGLASAIIAPFVAAERRRELPAAHELARQQVWVEIAKPPWRW